MADILPCIHRGKSLRYETCKTGCKASRGIQIRACALRGECCMTHYLYRVRQGVTLCHLCDDQKESA